MKNIVTIIIIISLFSCNRKVNATLNIQINLLDTISTRVHFKSIKVFKDGKIIKEFKQDYPIFLPQTNDLKNLSEGIYTVEYSNMFDELIKKEIKIVESKKYELEIFADQLKDKSDQTILGKQKVDEIVELKYKSSGCFSFKRDSIRIIREKYSWKIVHGQHKFNVADKTIGYLINLENQMRHIPERGCSTSDIFIFNYGTKTDTLIDDSCELIPYQKLAKFIKRNGL